MNSETRRKLVLWLSLYPDTSHPLDTERLYDFVRESCIYEDTIISEDLASILNDVHPEWNEQKREEFISDKIILIEHLQSFYYFCLQNKQADEEQEYTYKAKSIEDFVSSAFDLNYHEMYELVQAVKGNGEALNFFTVNDHGPLRTVVYTVSDISYTFDISQQTNIVKWLEDNCMDGMDADSWYGFQYAMERSENE
ncbi:MAG: hypothetical protein J6B91_01515 [Prevotella sp.]|nr:hypothetical protein [Prevotella sp.]